MKYLVSAYILVWIILFIYVFVLGNRLNKLKKQLELIEEVENT